jgi:hypothetical protein
MIANTAIFTCSICGEPSTEICAYCTKDACGNHRCVRCKRCSDCCECEFPLSAEEVEEDVKPDDVPAEEMNPEVAAIAGPWAEPLADPAPAPEAPSESIEGPAAAPEDGFPGPNF